MADSLSRLQRRHGIVDTAAVQSLYARTAGWATRHIARATRLAARHASAEAQGDYGELLLARGFVRAGRPADEAAAASDRASLATLPAHIQRRADGGGIIKREAVRDRTASALSLASGLHERLTARAGAVAGPHSDSTPLVIARTADAGIAHLEPGESLGSVQAPRFPQPTDIALTHPGGSHESARKAVDQESMGAPLVALAPERGNHPSARDVAHAVQSVSKAEASDGPPAARSLTFQANALPLAIARKAADHESMGAQGDVAHAVRSVPKAKASDSPAAARSPTFQANALPLAIARKAADHEPVPAAAGASPMSSASAQPRPSSGTSTERMFAAAPMPALVWRHPAARAAGTGHAHSPSSTVLMRTSAGEAGSSAPSGNTEWSAAQASSGAVAESTYSPELDFDRLADQVLRRIVGRVRIERERRGASSWS